MYIKGLPVIIQGLFTFAQLGDWPCAAKALLPRSGPR
jgi:hypothetical protein